MRSSIEHFRIHKSSKLNYKLSILIPTLFSRSDQLRSLVANLNFQIQTKPVQVLWLGDNKSVTVGEKRNNLLSLAKGDFVAFIDDDDEVSHNYIEVLLKAIDDNQNKTVICFRGEQTTDGHQDLPFRYDVNYGRNFKQMVDGARWKCMLPDHLCAWNRSKITKKFPLKSLGEDHDWAREMAFTYTEADQVLLTSFLYYYKYNKNTTECRR